MQTTDHSEHITKRARIERRSRNSDAQMSPCARNLSLCAVFFDGNTGADEMGSGRKIERSSARQPGEYSPGAGKVCLMIGLTLASSNGRRAAALADELVPEASFGAGAFAPGRSAWRRRGGPGRSGSTIGTP